MRLSQFKAVAVPDRAGVVHSVKSLCRKHLARCDEKRSQRRKGLVGKLCRGAVTFSCRFGQIG
jgi:hypothetical protein